MSIPVCSDVNPTANILGIEAGYNGPGTKTVLPKEARAKMDIRLVPDSPQVHEPNFVLRGLRELWLDFEPA